MIRFTDKRALWYILIILAALKLFFIYTNNKSFELNGDEKSNYIIASNYLKGMGCVEFKEETGIYKKTCYQAAFPFFIYLLLQKSGIGEEPYVIFIFLLSVILYAVSIYYFYGMVKIFFRNPHGCLAATCLYGIYPSNIYYIGSLFLYENIAVPILVIVVCKLLRIFIDGRTRWHDFFIIPLSITISCLYRSHMIFIYMVTLLICLVMLSIRIVKDKRRVPGVITIFIITFFMVTTAFIPALKKNHNIFGKYVLSTQYGFELLQGHNPVARGSFNNKWSRHDSVMYEYVKNNIPDIEKLNEYEEGMARGKLAIGWILNNPARELKLMARKIAIFFLPRNYGSLPGAAYINIINLIVHLLFLAALAYSILRFHTLLFRKEDPLVLAPIAAVILLSLIFFVGYRWRYYAEPFMIIYIFSFFQKLIDEKRGDHSIL